MRKLIPLMLTVMISIALIACNSGKYDPNSSTTQNETSRPLTEGKDTSPSQTVESK